MYHPTCTTDTTLRAEHRFASLPIPAQAHAAAGPVASVPLVDRVQLQEQLRSFSNSLRTPAEPVDPTGEEAGVAEVLAASTGLQECSICVTSTAYVLVDECNHSMCGTLVVCACDTVAPFPRAVTCARRLCLESPKEPVCPWCRRIIPGFHLARTRGA